MNETGSHDLYSRLNNELSRFKQKVISLERLFFIAKSSDDEMSAFLQNPGGQALFQYCVNKLVSDQILTPMGKKPRTVHGLNLKYKIHKEPEITEPAVTSDMIPDIAQTSEEEDYYLKYPQDYMLDKELVDVISKFLKKNIMETVTINERAYQLFGDEKLFKGDGKHRSRGETVLIRMGLDYASLGCIETPEPFFCFQSKEFYNLATRDIYIIENKDTFWSFKRAVMDAPSRIKTDMLVYGEGRKIINSFRFMEEYAIDPQKDRFFYFGDLDPEGINTYCELSDEYPQYNIAPFTEGYRAMWEIGREKEPVKTTKKRWIRLKKIKTFIEALASAPPGTSDMSWSIMLKNHLIRGFYIPQEALSAAGMKKRFGTNASQ